MSKNYTAKEMRDLAEMIDHHGGAFVLTDPSVIEANVAMLRQAADDMERAKNYEYGVLWSSGDYIGRVTHISTNVSMAMVRADAANLKFTQCRLVRRSVGEWEAVK